MYRLWPGTRVIASCGAWTFALQVLPLPFQLCYSPRSFEGGDLYWLWAPYSVYRKVDGVYDVPAYEAHDGFVNAQGALPFHL